MDEWAIIYLIYSKGSPHTGAVTPMQLDFGGVWKKIKLTGRWEERMGFTYKFALSSFRGVSEAYLLCL